MDDEKSTAHPDFAINKSFEISGGSQYPESRAELGGENSVEYGNEVPMNGESNVAKEIEQVGPELTEKSDDPKAKGQIKDDKKDRKEAKIEAKKEDDPISENVLILIFRFVWEFQKTKQEVKNKVTCENIKPQNLVSLRSFPKIFRNVYVGFRLRKVIYE